MKTEPIVISPANLIDYIESNELCIIKAGLEKEVNFNGTLNNQITQFYKTTVKIGGVNIQELDYTNSFVQPLINKNILLVFV